MNKLITLLIISVLISSNIFILESTLVNGESYDEWLYYKYLTFDEGYENKQINFNVSYNVNMQNDFDDLRFFDNDTGDLLSAYAKSIVNNNYANIWLKLGNSNVIMMLFGNDAINNYWSLNNIFEEVLPVYIALPIDEGSGNILKDYSGNGFNATITDGSYNWFSSGGKYNASILNLNTAYLNFTNNIPNTLQNFSFYAEFSVTTSIYERALMSFGNTTSDTQFNLISVRPNTGLLRFTMRDKIGYSFVNFLDVGNTTNSHFSSIGISYNNSYTFMQQNGTIISSVLPANNSGQNLNVVSICSLKRTSLMMYWIGNISNIYIFNSSLSESSLHNLDEYYIDCKIVNGYVCLRNFISVMPNYDLSNSYINNLNNINSIIEDNNSELINLFLIFGVIGFGSLFIVIIATKKGE